MNTEMTIKKLPVSMLKPAKYNPRKDLKPGDPAYEKVKRSLRDFGYVDPVIWNEVTGNIVGGHQRYKVLTAEGATEIDCVVVHIENPNDEKALNVALNKAVGEWEPKALADLLSDLQLAGYDVGATGFDAAEIDDLFSKVHDKDVKDDDTKLDPETITPFVKAGDLWTLGNIRCSAGMPQSLKTWTRSWETSAQPDRDGPALQRVLRVRRRQVHPERQHGGRAVFLIPSGRFSELGSAPGGRRLGICIPCRHGGPELPARFKEAGFHISGVCIWVKTA